MEISIRVYRNNCMAKNYCLTSGCVNTVSAVYMFDDEWKELQRLAVFETIAGTIHVPLDEDDRCIIPPVVLEQAGTIRVGAMGVNGDKTFTTTTIPMVIVKGVDKEGTSDPGYSPTVLEHLLQLAEETRDIAEGVRDDADAGKFDGYTPRRGVDYWTTSDQNTILTKTRSQSKVTAYENVYRYERIITLYQNGAHSTAFSAAGKQCGSRLQSWYFTDYQDSTCYGDYTAMFGGYNTNMGNANMICGTRNDVTGRALLVSGERNLIEYSAECGLFFGRYGYVNNSQIICAIGNGTSASQRYNLLEIHKNGKIVVQGSYNQIPTELTVKQLGALASLNIPQLATKTWLQEQITGIAVPRREILITQRGEVYEINRSAGGTGRVKLDSINDVLTTMMNQDVITQYKFIYSSNNFTETVELNAEMMEDTFYLRGMVPIPEFETYMYYEGKSMHTYDDEGWGKVEWTSGMLGVI